MLFHQLLILNHQKPRKFLDEFEAYTTAIDFLLFSSNGTVVNKF